MVEDSFLLFYILSSTNLNKVKEKSVKNTLCNINSTEKLAALQKQLQLTETWNHKPKRSCLDSRLAGPPTNTALLT